MLAPLVFRKRLLRWYERAQRHLPWRQTSDPWRILVSEIMLQQTRVEAVIPFYERFLERFPTANALAQAPPQDVLTAWSGLGYYSRARNLQRAASIIGNRFPQDYDAIRGLPGIGPYTAAAVGSIAFGLPVAAVDGNVLRVISRVACDAGDIASSKTRRRFTEVAQQLLDPRRPGDFNQAMMELGATVCVPRNPSCLLCPVARNCIAHQQGRQNELPVKTTKAAPQSELLQVLIAEHHGKLLLRQRSSTEKRMPGFWELPDLARVSEEPEPVPVGSFRHTIVNTLFTVQVFRTDTVPASNDGLRWVSAEALSAMPLTTITRKALAAAKKPRAFSAVF